MVETPTIISPDTTRAKRIPPGQRGTDRFPVLHHGSIPRLYAHNWALSISGLVSQEKLLDYKAFNELPQSTVVSDIHCVTGWSRLDNLWQGVTTSTLQTVFEVLPQAHFVMVHGAGGYTTNLSLEDFFQTDVLFATKHDGVPLTEEHGGPVRLVVPRLYFWKSA